LRGGEFLRKLGGEGSQADLCQNLKKREKEGNTADFVRAICRKFKIWTSPSRDRIYLGGKKRKGRKKDKGSQGKVNGPRGRQVAGCSRTCSFDKQDIFLGGVIVAKYQDAKRGY